MERTDSALERVSGRIRAEGPRADEFTSKLLNQMAALVTYMSPIERIRAEGPDWPEWCDDDGRTVKIKYDQGQFYMTRVEGDVYGVSNSWIEKKIFVYRYPASGEHHIIPVGSRDGESQEDTMRELAENLPAFLIRWTL